MLPTPSPLWRAQDCAAYLRRSPRWLWAQLSRPADQPGSIPHVYIGRTPRFFPDDIAEWVPGVPAGGHLRPVEIRRA